MAEKNKKLSAFEQEQIDIAKKVLEYKLGSEANIVTMLYKNPDLLRENNFNVEDFHHNCWKVYFQIIKSLILDEKKMSVSDIDIGLYLEKHSKLKAKYDEFGGFQTIESASTYVNEENFESYVRDLRKWNVVLKLIKKGFPCSKNRLSEICDMSAEEIYQEYEGYINHIFSNIEHEIKSYNALEGLHELVDDLNAGDNIGLPICAELLNKEIGGLKRGNIYSLTAPSGAGKSTILINYILPSMLKHNERCCMFINEEDVKKVKKELLLYCCTNILNHPIQKVQLRDGCFDKETLEVLHKAADWLEEQDRNHNLIVIPLEHYTTDIVIKLMKKYKNLFDIDFFILDTFKESSDSKEEGYREMLKSSVKLYDLIKPACLNVCLVMSMQTSKSSLKNRHLTNMDIGQSRSVVDVISCSLLCRRAEPDEYSGEKKELKCFKLEGKNGKTKIPFSLDKDKYYMIFFLAKNRFGNTDVYSIVSEIDLSTNRFKDVGYTVVPEDW